MTLKNKFRCVHTHALDIYDFEHNSKVRNSREDKHRCFQFVPMNAMHSECAPFFSRIVFPSSSAYKCKGIDCSRVDGKFHCFDNNYGNKAKEMNAEVIEVLLLFEAQAKSPMD